MKTAPNGLGAISSKADTVESVRSDRSNCSASGGCSICSFFQLVSGAIGRGTWAARVSCSRASLTIYSALQASVILGLIGTAWYINVFFSPIPTFALFTASFVAVSILLTVMFLHARGSVLLAIVMHWSIVSGKEIARISFSAAPEPPDWLRAGVFLDALHCYGTVMSFAFLVNAILYGLVIFGAMTTISALTAKNFER